jgi:hypothetical protein
MEKWKLLAFAAFSGGALMFGTLGTACTVSTDVDNSAGLAGSAGSAAGSAGSAGAAAGSAGAAGTAGTAGAAGGTTENNNMVKFFDAYPACQACILDKTKMTGKTTDGMGDCDGAVAGCDGTACDKALSCLSGQHMDKPADSLACNADGCLVDFTLDPGNKSLDFMTCMSQKCGTECMVNPGFQPEAMGCGMLSPAENAPRSPAPRCRHVRQWGLLCPSRRPPL